MVSCLGFQVEGFMFRVSGVGFQVSGVVVDGGATGSLLAAGCSVAFQI